MPRENVPTRLSATSARPTRSSAAAMRRVALAALEADQRRGVAQILARRQVVVEADRVGQIADPALDLRAARAPDRSRARARCPSVISVRPSIIRMVVVLPAPFGPEQAEDLAARDA